MLNKKKKLNYFDFIDNFESDSINTSTVFLLSISVDADEVLFDDIKDIIRSSMRDDEIEFRNIRYQGKYAIYEAIQEALKSTLFSPEKKLIIADFYLGDEKVKKQNRNKENLEIKAKSIEELMRFSNEVCENKIIIIDTYSELSELYDNENIICIQLDKLDYQGIRKYVTRMFNKNNIQISDSDSIELFLEKIDNNLLIGKSEIFKLLMLKDSPEDITISDIENITNLNSNAFKLSARLAQGNLNRALEILDASRIANINPGELLSALKRRYSLMMQIFLIKNNQLSDTEKATKVGVKVSEYRFALKDLSYYNFSQLSQIKSILDDIEFNLRSGKLFPLTALNLAVTSIISVMK